MKADITRYILDVIANWNQLLQPMMEVLTPLESRALQLFIERQDKFGNASTESFRKFQLPDDFTTYLLLVSSAKEKILNWLWQNYGIEKFDDLELERPKTSSDGRIVENAKMQAVREVVILDEHKPQAIKKKNLTTSKNKKKVSK